MWTIQIVRHLLLLVDPLYHLLILRKWRKKTCRALHLLKSLHHRRLKVSLECDKMKPWKPILLFSFFSEKNTKYKNNIKRYNKDKKCVHGIIILKTKWSFERQRDQVIIFSAFSSSFYSFEPVWPLNFQIKGSHTQISIIILYHNLSENEYLYIEYDSISWKHMYAY